MTTTPKLLEANRRNALESTGPRSAEGKAAASRNALKYPRTQAETAAELDALLPAVLAQALAGKLKRFGVWVSRVRAVGRTRKCAYELQ